MRKLYHYLKSKRGILTIGIVCTHLALYAQNPPEKKNVLFIMADQFRYDALSIANSNSVVSTPNLDRLAAEGVMFSNAYTPMAVCGPARACILTGHTVENTGVNTNDKTYDYSGNVMNMPTFDEILNANGYRNEYYGKWHALSSKAQVYQNPVSQASNGASVFGSGGQTHIYRDYLAINEPADPNPGVGQFDELISRRPYFTEPIDKYHGWTQQQLDNQGLQHTQPDQHGGLQIDSAHSITAFQAKQTIEAIERLKDSTFSITCSFHFPHAPMVPTEPYFSMYPESNMQPAASIHDPMTNSPYAKANGRLNHTEYADQAKIKYMMSNYYGLIKEIDDWVGHILAKLDEHNLTDNTLIIFTSDHGEMLGAHGMREKNVFYEESSHIPLLVRFPEDIPSATVVDEYVSLIDLFPTILDYLDVPAQPSDGKSLKGLVDGTETAHGEYVVTEWDFRGPTEPNYMVVSDGWKLITSYGSEASDTHALYDLTNDPHEMTNLIGSNPNANNYIGKVEELRDHLVTWLIATGSQRVEEIRFREIVQGYIPQSETIPGEYVDECESLNGWNSGGSLTLDGSDVKQGAASISFSGSSTPEFSSQISPAFNSSANLSTARFEFWYYVSDASKISSTNNQVELGSGSGPDVDEYNWKITNLNNGWNFIRLFFNEANTLGNPDLTNINWFRRYSQKTGSVTTKIDGLQIIDPYVLDVMGGTGDGEYNYDASISIAADPPQQGQVFDQWVVSSGSPTIADPGSAVTDVVLGAANATVTATYTSTSQSEMLDDCDALTGWTSSQSLVLSGNYKQGTGSLQFTGATEVEFKKAFSPVYSANYPVSDAALQFWYYVSDASQMTGVNQVELGSGGAPDVNEYNWSLPTLSNGWNLITLALTDANVLGTPNLNQLNWIRIYNFKNSSITTRLDAVKIINNNAALLDDCDALSGWSTAGSNSLALSTNMQEGTGSIQVSGSGTNEFQKVFSPAYNAGLTPSNARLEFWYYVSDPSKMSTTSNQVELGSGGVADVNEYHWILSSFTAGWNLISLDVSAAGTTGGTPDLNAINWFRIYNSKSGTVTNRIDAIRLYDKTNARVAEVGQEMTRNQVLIYPNPTSDYVTIDLGDISADHLQVDVYNLAGIKVIESDLTQTNSSRYRLSLAGLPDGVYVVEIAADTGIKVSRRLRVQ